MEKRIHLFQKKSTFVHLDCLLELKQDEIGVIGKILKDFQERFQRNSSSFLQNLTKLTLFHLQFDKKNSKEKILFCIIYEC